VPVRGDRDTASEDPMPVEGARERAVLDIPDLDPAVATGGQRTPSVRGQRDRRHGPPTRRDRSDEGAAWRAERPRQWAQPWPPHLAPRPPEERPDGLVVEVEQPRLQLRRQLRWSLRKDRGHALEHFSEVDQASLGSVREGVVVQQRLWSKRPKLCLQKGEVGQRCDEVAFPTGGCELVGQLGEGPDVRNSRVQRAGREVPRELVVPLPSLRPGAVLVYHLLEQAVEEAEQLRTVGASLREVRGKVREQPRPDGNRKVLGRG